MARKPAKQRAKQRDHLALARLGPLIPGLSLAVGLAVGLALGAAPQPALAQNGLAGLWARLTGGDARADLLIGSNGRIEAQALNVATKYAGQLVSLAADEGDLVEAGAALAQLDDRDMRAQILGADAAVMRARAARQLAEAGLAQARSALAVARTNHARVVRLQADGHAAQAVLDDATNALQSAEASQQMAQAQIADASAMIAAAEAEKHRLDIALQDLTLTAPRRGRVLYRLHEPGEVLAAGAPVMTLLDLGDVSMNIYLPAGDIGRLALGDEARLVLDPIPDYVLPATITFISPESQFTPKAVETAQERADLVFRVKLSLPRDLLARFEPYVKSGVRGMGYLRRDPAGADWPRDLQIRLPD